MESALFYLLPMAGFVMNMFKARRIQRNASANTFKTSASAMRSMPLPSVQIRLINNCRIQNTESAALLFNQDELLARRNIFTLLEMYAANLLLCRSAIDQASGIRTMIDINVPAFNKKNFLTEVRFV